jgi:hypothetical protein
MSTSSVLVTGNALKLPLLMRLAARRRPVPEAPALDPVEHAA